VFQPTKNRFLSDEDLWGSSVHQSSVSVDRFKARERLRNRLYVHDSVSEFTDGTNSDVIPFCDSEYEEIIYSDQGDTDDQHELEVELGRNEHSMERDQITLDGWMEMRLENEMQGNISDQNISMKEQSSEFIEAATTSAQKTNNVSSGGLEILDIGYSSESHSYDEREACHDHATHMMRTNEHLKLDEMNCREDFGAEICETVGLFSVGQQSLTSAYNSASDLSENHRAALVNDIPGRRVRSSYCGGTAMDCVDSAATSSADQYPRHFAAGCGTVDDCCTDDDFSKLKELSFDDIPMMFMKEESEDDCNVTSEHSTVLQLPRRSLDSLLPCDNEKLFKMEKRVSSVEIIMDTLGGSKESPASICGEIHLRNPFVNTLLTNTETDTAALSSCDASSEGTLSESESSESAVSEDDTSPRKFKSARRLRRENNKHETPSKRACTGHMRSPLKRRGDSLTDVSDIGEYERPLRSSSDGAISDLANDHTTVKRSKVCRAQSDISCERSVRASSSNRSVRKGGIQSEHHGFRTSSKKNHQSTIKQLLNFSGDGLEDVITVNGKLLSNRDMSFVSHVFLVLNFVS
jgi:hypothetical protein